MAFFGCAIDFLLFHFGLALIDYIQVYYKVLNKM